MILTNTQPLLRYEEIQLFEYVLILNGLKKWSPFFYADAGSL